MFDWLRILIGYIKYREKNTKLYANPSLRISITYSHGGLMWPEIQVKNKEGIWKPVVGIGLSSGGHYGVYEYSQIESEEIMEIMEQYDVPWYDRGSKLTEIPE